MSGECAERKIKIRRYTDNEPCKPIPPDVLLAQTQHDESLCPKLSTSPVVNKPRVSNSLHKFISEYMERYRRDRRRATVCKMEYYTSKFLEFAVTNCLLETIESITTDTIDDYVTHRMREGISDYSALREISMLSGIFKRAIDKDIIAKNPVTRVAKDLRDRYPESQTVKYLEPEVVSLLLSTLDRAIVDNRIPLAYADLARVQLATGIRCSAVCNMRWDWIDSNWIISVPPEFDKAKAGYRCCITSDGKAVLERRKRELGSEGWIFPGTKVDHSWHWLKRVCKHYGVPIADRFNHRLRHTPATRLVDQNVDLLTIGSQLGHRNYKTTQIYAKVREQAKVKAMESVRFE